MALEHFSNNTYTQAFLALLLVRGIPHCLTDCQIEEVHFQTGRLGWNTDDLLVVCKRGDERERHLAAQVKRTFHVSSKNKECCETIESAWQDFQSGTCFDKSKDLIAIITLRGTERLLAHFCALLDCARASLDAADFLRRIEPQKFINNKVPDYRNEIRKIVEAANGGPIEDDDFWEFLKSLHLLSFDLNTSTRQTEAWVKTLLANTTQGSDLPGCTFGNLE